MSRIVYVNGRYRPARSAMVHIEDRGYQFSDGVYEVCEVRGGRLVDERRHMQRLQRSLGELRIANEWTSSVLAQRVAPHRALETRIAATAICGRALDQDHPAWVHVEDMLGLGAQARSVAWSALRDRARRNS